MIDFLFFFFKRKSSLNRHQLLFFFSFFFFLAISAVFLCKSLKAPFSPGCLYRTETFINSYFLWFTFESVLLEVRDKNRDTPLLLVLFCEFLILRNHIP